MTLSSLVPVVLCGGVGARLWPLSRQASPKPFQKLTSTRPMLVETLSRIPETVAGVDMAAPVVVAFGAHAALVRGALMVSDDSDGTVLSEPVGKNTAPAIAMAALFALAQEGEDALILVLPSDHDIASVGAFHAAIEAAVKLAQEGRLVTFGVTPDRPESGYGYIAPGAPLGGGFAIDRFVEKPDAEQAAQMIGAGALWNAGIFLFSARGYLDALKAARPEMAALCGEAFAGRTESGKRTYTPDAGVWAGITGESVDYAVMQTTAKGAVVPVDMDWSDIGSFSAIHERREKDMVGNVVSGRAVLEQSTGNLVISEGGRTVTLIGCEDMVVIDTPDAVLVVPRDKAQDVRTLRAHLKAIGRDDLL